MSATPDAPLLAKVRRRLKAAVDRRRRARSPQPPRRPAPDPVYPEVVEQRTNVGPLMDAIVTRVKRNQAPLGVDPNYDVVREHFDHHHFMLAATGLQETPDVDPIRLFMRNGANAVNSPDYNFSMKNYLERHPERAEGPEPSPYLAWVAHGRAAGEIADPAQGIEKMAPVLGLEPSEIVEELVATRTDMMERLRTGTLGEMFAKAAEIEPLIGGVWSETTRARLVPLGAKHVAGQVAAVHSCHEQAGFRRARLVIVTNKPRWGGARRLEGHLAHALDGTIAPEDIVVIYTDESGTTPEGRFPDGVREVDFFEAARGLPLEHKQQALVSVLRSFQADAIININSRMFYRAMLPYGRALAASERIFLCFFCNEQYAQGNWEGWSLRWLYAAFDYVAGVITDSEFLRDELVERYQLSESDAERIHVFRAPVEPELPVAPRPQADPARRPVVCWAGRWDRQKRVDLALDIARRMPDVDFRFWGEAVLQGDPLTSVPDNVTLEGLYGHISELDLSQADAWLYTSAWDGVPSMLLEVAMLEVPIVASLVGGVGEILSDADGWPIAQCEDAEAYEKALREILADPAEARGRAHALRERLLRERTATDYGDYAARVLLQSREETR